MTKSNAGWPAENARWLSVGVALSAVAAATVAGTVAALLFTSTLQWQINGSGSPYATDVGEIQNALPRWGTLHFTGYPLYSMTGSAIVTLLGVVGVEPAAAASIVSLLWGALAIGLLAALAVVVGAHPAPAAAAAVVMAVATSMWIDASIAEVHTLTAMFTAASLLIALVYRHKGGTGLLALLSLVFAHGVLHMRPVALLAPSLALLVWPRRHEIMRRLPLIVAIAVVSPAIYLYMPIREWMGASWTFGETSTWRGFWAMLLDTKADRIVQPISDPGELLNRIKIIGRLLHDDLPAPVLAAGIVGLWIPAFLPGDGMEWIRGGNREAVPSSGNREETVPSSGNREAVRLSGRHVSRRLEGATIAAALHLAWIPYALLTLVIWEGRVSDALLAVKLPVVMASAVGLALWFTLPATIARLRQFRAPPQSPRTKVGTGLATLGGVVLLGLAAAVAGRNAPKVVAITRDDGLHPMVVQTDQAIADPPWPVESAAGGEPHVTLLAPWGHTYWALAYEQAYGDALDGVLLVDHNADLERASSSGLLLTRNDSFYTFPKSWWEERLGAVFLEAFSPELIAVRRAGSRQPIETAGRVEAADRVEAAGRVETGVAASTNSFFEAPFHVNTDLLLANAFIHSGRDATLEVYLEWTAAAAPARDYSVAVHLVAEDPPTDADDILDQADATHPVAGWSPTSQWAVGARVRDAYRLHIPPGSTPEAVRVTAYYATEDGGFENGEWLSLPVP